MKSLRKTLTYSNVTATVALFLALAGGTTAIALSGKNSVKKDDIAKNAVREKHISKGTVKASEVADGAIGSGELLDGAVGAAEIGPAAVGPAALQPGSVGTQHQAPAPVAHVSGEDVLVPPNSQGTLVSFSNDSTGDAFDPFGMWDPAEPRDLAAPVDGVYMVVARIVWENDDTTAAGGLLDHGMRMLQISAGGQTERVVMGSKRLAAERTRQQVVLLTTLAAGETAGVAVGQDNEDDSDVNIDEAYATIAWLGAAP